MTPPRAESHASAVTCTTTESSTRWRRAWLLAALACATACDGGFRDLLSDTTYDRSGRELASTGLYLDMPPWSHHAFAVGGA